jgi:hypothetical protein
MRGGLPCEKIGFVLALVLLAATGPTVLGVDCPVMPTFDYEGAILAGWVSQDWDTAMDANGNGILDKWECALLATVLCDDTHPYNAELVAVFDANVAGIQGCSAAWLFDYDLGNFFSGLCTMSQANIDLWSTGGGYGESWFDGCALAPYGTPPDEPFSPEGDLDSDGLTNRQEYNAIRGDAGTIQDYVEAAMGGSGDGGDGDGDGGTRSFYMGFTPWPYAATIAAIDDTYVKIQQHGDIVAIHLDNGIPWPEAYAGTPYHPNFEAELNSIGAHVQEGKAVYLGICVLNGSRDGIAFYRGASGSMPLPSPWDTYGFADQPVIDAYSSYCIDMIDRFDPVFFNYAIEATDLAVNNASLWAGFAEFCDQVFARIKAVYPDLMVGVSACLRTPGSSQMTTIANAFDDIEPFVDYVGASLYPYTDAPWWSGDGDPANLDASWLSQITMLANGKPVAVCETGFIAENCVIPAYGWDIDGAEVWQNEYVEMLLTEANKLEALFVIWWTIADFDDLWETFTGETRNIARIWRDTGLYDGDLVARAGLATWDAWLGRERGGEIAEVPAGWPGVVVCFSLVLLWRGVMALKARELSRPRRRERTAG